MLYNYSPDGWEAVQVHRHCGLVVKHWCITFRDWSLITGRGGYTIGKGASQVLTLHKGGGYNFGNAEWVGGGGGATNNLGVFLPWALKVLGRVQKVSTL